LGAWFWAGIGFGGLFGDGQILVSNLKIVSGNITAFAVEGAGMGAGYAELRNSSVINLSVLSGTIATTSTDLGAGTGSGFGENSGDSRVRSIHIQNAVITAVGSSGSGIGTGTRTGTGTGGVV
jgi:hypothetical protein